MLSIIFCLFSSCKHKYGYYISKSIKKKLFGFKNHIHRHTHKFFIFDYIIVFVCI